MNDVRVALSDEVRRTENEERAVSDQIDRILQVGKYTPQPKVIIPIPVPKKKEAVIIREIIPEKSSRYKRLPVAYVRPMGCAGKLGHGIKTIPFFIEQLSAGRMPKQEVDITRISVQRVKDEKYRLVFNTGGHVFRFPGSYTIYTAEVARATCLEIVNSVIRKQWQRKAG